MKRFLLRIVAFGVAMVALLVLTLVLNPAGPENYYRAFWIKKNLISNVNRDSSIVIVGGSNVAFGFNSVSISEKTGIPVINTGLNAGLGLKCIVEETFPFLKDGDILIFSPEYDHFVKYGAYGWTSFVELLCLGNWAYLPKMCMRQWITVGKNIPKVISNRVDYRILNTFPFKKEIPATYKISAFNNNGDIVAHWGENHTLLKIDVQKKDPQAINNHFIGWLTVRLCEIMERGVKIVMLPPVLAATEYINREDEINSIDSALRQECIPFICAPKEMVYPDSLFYDTFYHLDSLGAAIHSADLVRLLKEHNIIPRN